MSDSGCCVVVVVAIVVNVMSRVLLVVAIAVVAIEVHRRGIVVDGVQQACLVRCSAPHRYRSF